MYKMTEDKFEQWFECEVKRFRENIPKYTWEGQQYNKLVKSVEDLEKDFPDIASTKELDDYGLKIFHAMELAARFNQMAFFGDFGMDSSKYGILSEELEQRLDVLFKKLFPKEGSL